MSLSLRWACSDDEAFLYELYAGTRKDELDAWGWGIAEQRAFLQQQFRAQQQSYALQFREADQHIIVQSDRPIGRMIVLREDEEFCLVDIALLPEHRNKGIGGRLIRNLLEKASQAGKPVRLQVLKASPAIRLYQRLGFAVVGDDGLYLQMRASASPRDEA